MAVGDIKTFDISYSGLTLKVNAVDMGDGTTKFFIECLNGYADLNALYWGDDVNDGSSYDLGTKKDNSLNMNGTGADFDGGMKLSSPGLGPDGTAKSTYITAGETLSFCGNVNWNDVDTFGIRATSTSTAEGSIKGVDNSGGVTTAPQVAIDDVTVTEGVDPKATFTISLDHAYLYDVVLTYTTSDDSAADGSDYTGASHTVTIPAGSTSIEVCIPILDDDNPEPTETFTVTLTNVLADLPGGVVGDLPLANAFSGPFGDDTGIGTILDIDEDGGGGGGGGPPPGDDFPTWAQDISHIVLYFQQDEGDVKPTGDPPGPAGDGDGYYTVAIDAWPGSATNNLDDNIADILQWLGENDPNVSTESDLLGVLIKGGTQTTAYYAYGEHNENGADTDPIPAGAPQIVYPPDQGNSDGNALDQVWTYAQVFGP